MDKRKIVCIAKDIYMYIYIYLKKKQPTLQIVDCISL